MSLSWRTSPAHLQRFSRGFVRAGVILVILSLIAIAACEIAIAETQVTAEGVAAVVAGDDPGRIRDEALRDALRRAVEIGVGVMVRTESQMENYEVLRDQIWTATSGYVRSYQVLRETQDEDFFRITIRAVVDTLALGENLENLGFEIGLIGNPRIVVTVQEWVCENEPGAAPVCVEQPFSVAGDALQRGFLKKGFTLVDKSRLEQLTDPEVIDLAAKGDTAAAASLARALDADLTLAGNVRVESAGTTAAGGFDWYKALATLSAKVVLRDTGEVVSSVLLTTKATKTSFSAAASAATEKASSLAMPQLVFETIAGLNYQDTEMNREIGVHIHGVSSFSEATAVQQAVEAIREAESADLRTYDDSLLAIDVHFLGTSVDLAQVFEAPWFASRLSTEIGRNALIKIVGIDYGSIEAELILE